MSNQPDPLDEFRSVWQQEDGLPSEDLQAMAKRAVWLGWRMRLTFCVELITTIIGASYCFRLLFDESGLAMKSFASFGVLFCLLGFWGVISTRAGAWAKSSKTSREILEHEIARTHSSIRYLRFNGLLGLLGIPFIALAIWVIQSEPGQRSDEREMFAYVVYALMTVGFISYWLFLPKLLERKNQELRELEQRLEQF